MFDWITYRVSQTCSGSANGKKGFGKDAEGNVHSCGGKEDGDEVEQDVGGSWKR